MDPLTAFINGVANQGFAIVVAAFLLVRVDQRLDKIGTALTKILEHLPVAKGNES